MLPGRGEQRAVHRAEARQTHKHRDDPRHGAQVVVPKVLQDTRVSLSGFLNCFTTNPFFLVYNLHMKETNTVQNKRFNQKINKEALSLRAEDLTSKHATRTENWQF